MNDNKVRTTVTVLPTLKERMDLFAWKHGANWSDIAARAWEEYMKDHTYDAEDIYHELVATANRMVGDEISPEADEALSTAAVLLAPGDDPEDYEP